MPIPKAYRLSIVAVGIILLSSVYLYNSAVLQWTASRYKHAVNTGEKDLAQEWTNDPVPRRDFIPLSKYHAHNIHESSKYAFSTLYCDRTPDIRSPYFQAAQQIIWRLLWSNYRSKYPVVVFVCPFIPEENRKILRGQGAIVKEIGLLDDVIPDKTLLYSRWLDVMSKLNIWAEVEWKKIVFLDLDAFPITNIDELFDLVPAQNCIKEKLNAEDRAIIEDMDGGDKMCEYLFASVKQADSINAGVMLLTPNLDMHARLLRGAKRTDEYIATDMEQGVLNANIGFGSDSAFPTHYLGQQWNGYLNYYEMYLEKDLAVQDGELKIVHAKLWVTLLDKHNPMRVMWEQDWMEMCRFYDSNLFEEARRTGSYPVAVTLS